MASDEELKSAREEIVNKARGLSDAEKKFIEAKSKLEELQAEVGDFETQVKMKKSNFDDALHKYLEVSGLI